MTGIYGRRHWELLPRNEFDNCRHHQRDAMLLITDTNHSKSINDTWGHDVGNQTIVTLTRQLQMILHGNDVTGRFGGDEFAAIMCGTPAGSTTAAVSRVHERLTQLHLSCAPQVDLRISVGITPLTSKTEHCREWLKPADMALYKVKNSGRSHTEVAV